MILVCGEGLVDLVPTSNDSLAPLQPALGGGPFNVAIAASRLGAPTRFLSRLSTDSFGNALVSRLQSEGVDTSLVQRGPEPTTLAVTSLLADGSAQYTFYTEGTADRFVDTCGEYEADIACFGTCSLALEPGASKLADLLHRLAAQGTFIALDPNIRSFYNTAAHRQFLHSLLPDVALLKLSAEEADFLGPTDVPARVVTHGSEGLSVDVQGVRIDVPSVAVSVEDTIGAGDTIMGALLAQFELYGDGDPKGFMEGLTVEQWRELLHYAAVAASITCSRVGANPPRGDEVRHALGG